jgi:hypothetical protein
MDVLLRLCLCLGRAHPGDWVDWLGHCQQRRAVLVHGFACTQPKLEMLLLSVTYSILVGVPYNEMIDGTGLLISNRPPTSDFASKYTSIRTKYCHPLGLKGCQVAATSYSYLSFTPPRPACPSEVISRLLIATHTT